MRSLPVVSAATLLAACAAASAAPEGAGAPQGVVDITWEWVSTVTPVTRVEVRDPERYTLFLQSDGPARVRFDCNQGSGTYEMAPGKLAFGPFMSTRMACPEDSQDAQYADGLQRVVSFFLRDGDLYLELPMDSGTMRFRRAR